VSDLLGTIGGLFHTVFFEPIFNALMLVYFFVSHVMTGGNFAVSVIILTLIVRACMIPLVRKQLRSQRVMQELQPRIAQLKQQYKNDQQGMLRAQQDLFKEHGYSPASGCLPLLIQMPFLYALYFAFFAVLQKQTLTVNGHKVAETTTQQLARINSQIYPFLPHITKLPDIHFFWLTLSQADPIHLLPILAGLLTFIQLRMAMPVRKPLAPGQQKDTTTQATQTTQYIMPVITMVFGWNFPAGLPLYWVVSTSFSAVQQYFLSGIGSLFVGVDRFVPYVKRWIPEPKDILTAAPANARALPAGARALASAAPEAPASEGGLRGMFRQLREQMAAAQSVAAEQRTAGNSSKGARNGTIVDADHDDGEKPFAVTSMPDGANGANGTSGGESAAARARRQRAAKAGPTLVKPGQTAPRARTELPEEAIAREATGPSPVEQSPLPEVAIARTAGSDSVRPPANTNKPAKPGNSSRPAPSVRKGTAKGSSSSRGRGGRPKGSR
jgi:YidC/Oxa1 family membrane protein insertase